VTSWWDTWGWRLKGPLFPFVFILVGTLILTPLLAWLKRKTEQRHDARGFEVKQNPGTMPGAEEKDNDHG
jgi:hypothetical protein